MNPLVSVIIPCYNAERWLSQTIHSVLQQTWKPIEVIVVDDGSTDHSLAIARSFQLPQIQVIAQPNRGASAARNRGLLAARGDYIQYLDADDLLSPDKIAAQIHLLHHHFYRDHHQQQDQSYNQPERLLAICNTRHFWDGNDPQTGRLETGGNFFADSDRPVEWLTQLLGGNGSGTMVHPAAWLVPRAVAIAAGNWNEKLSLDDDGEYFARVVLASHGIRHSPVGLTYYRKFKTGSSLSGGTTKRHQQSSLLAIDLKAQHLFRHTSDDQAKRAIARCYMERAVQAYPAHPEITDRALAQIRALGVQPDMPNLGGWRAGLLQQLFGWKGARRLSVAYHRRLPI